MNETKFERFQFKPFIIEAVKELGFHEPTEIQERLIPSVLKGESVIGQSQTGTGKTHAYLLPILNRLIQAKKMYKLSLQLQQENLQHKFIKKY